MPASDYTPNGVLQQCLLQWNVSGSLDGSTPAPGLQTKSGILTQQTRAPSQPYVIDVPGSAGLFDIDGFGGSAVMADRYLMWIRVVPARPINANFLVDIVDASGLVPSLGSAIVLDTIQMGAFAGDAFYSADLRLVPHGAVVRISGLGGAPPGQAHVVSMEARMASTAQADAELAEASCCLGRLLV